LQVQVLSPLRLNVSDWRTTVSDDRDDDVTPEPEDGSDVADSAAAPAADGADAGSGTAGDTGSAEAAAVARPSGKRRGSGRSSSRPVAKGPAAKGPAARGRATPTRTKQESPSKGNPVSRILRYLREVVAELRKVIWPTRNELITYTAVVLVFVAFMVALTSGLDLAFARGVLLVFG
jgi:preprotein translocase subunit SecE